MNPDNVPPDKRALLGGLSSSTAVEMDISEEGANFSAKCDDAPSGTPPASFAFESSAARASRAERHFQSGSAYGDDAGEGSGRVANFSPRRRAGREKSKAPLNATESLLPERPWKPLPKDPDLVENYMPPAHPQVFERVADIAEEFLGMEDPLAVLERSQQRLAGTLADLPDTIKPPQLHSDPRKGVEDIRSGKGYGGVPLPSWEELKGSLKPLLRPESRPSPSDPQAQHTEGDQPQTDHSIAGPGHGPGSSSLTRKRTIYDVPAARSPKSPRQTSPYAARDRSSMLHGLLAGSDAPFNMEEEFAEALFEPEMEAEAGLGLGGFSERGATSVMQYAIPASSDKGKGKAVDVSTATAPGPSYGQLERPVAPEPRSGGTLDKTAHPSDRQGLASHAAPSSRGKGKPAAKIKIPLAAVARNSDDAGWEPISDSLSFLREDHRKMHKSGSTSLREYKNMINHSDKYVDGSCCLQCLVVAHNRLLCDFDAAGCDHACNRCSRLGHHCSRLMMHNGEVTVAYVPLEAKHRDGSTRSDARYWFKQGLDVEMKPSSPVSRRKAQQQVNPENKRTTRGAGRAG